MKVYFDLTKKALKSVDLENQTIYTGDLVSTLEVISNQVATNEYVLLSAKLPNAREVGPYLFDGLRADDTTNNTSTWTFTLSKANGFTLVAGNTTFYLWLIKGNEKKCIGAVNANVEHATAVGDYSYFVDVDDSDVDDTLTNMAAQIDQCMNAVSLANTAISTLGTTKVDKESTTGKIYNDSTHKVYLENNYNDTVSKIKLDNNVKVSSQYGNNATSLSIDTSKAILAASDGSNYFMAKVFKDKAVVSKETTDIFVVDNSGVYYKGNNLAEVNTSDIVDKAVTRAKLSQELQDFLHDIPRSMVFKGSLGVGGTITELSEASEYNDGYTYKVITAGTYQGVVCKVGDVLVSNGTAWILIPSGDEPSGTVTNVAASGNAHITVSGSPITSSGTLRIGVESGYSIPSDSKQAEWDKITEQDLVLTGTGGLLTNAQRLAVGNGIVKRIIIEEKYYTRNDYESGQQNIIPIFTGAIKSSVASSQYEQVTQEVVTVDITTGVWRLTSKAIINTYNTNLLTVTEETNNIRVLPKSRPDIEIADSDDNSDHRSIYVGSNIVLSNDQDTSGTSNVVVESSSVSMSAHLSEEDGDSYESQLKVSDDNIELKVTRYPYDEEEETHVGSVVDTIIFDSNGFKYNNNQIEHVGNKVNSISSASTNQQYPSAKAVYDLIEALPEPMLFKGTLGTNGTITTLPAASSSNEGFTYKVIENGTYASQQAAVGDVFVSNGSEWVLIPSGDEAVVSDTWRTIQVNGTDLLGNGIGTGKANFKSGSGITVTGSGNDITFTLAELLYSATKTYAANQVALYNGYLFLSLVANNIGNTPDSTQDTVYWARVFV